MRMTIEFTHKVDFWVEIRTLNPNSPRNSFAQAFYTSISF